MGRSPCCDKVGLKKGPWTPEEDQKLLAYIEEHGHGSWRALPAKAGLQRCGKSCRLRWTNYLRPDIKRGKFSLQEEQTIIQLHALLGNRWSAIATHLPKRTDNEIKNYWNTHLKKRLAKMGIDPVTHKPKNESLLSSDGQSKNAANLSHMAQWESARLEAEARLVKQSKLRSSPIPSSLNSPEFGPVNKPGAPRGPALSCLDVLKTWKGGPWGNTGEASSAVFGAEVESPTSTLSYSENAPKSNAFIEFVGDSSGSSDGGIMKEEGEEDWKGLDNTANPSEYRDGTIGTFALGMCDMSLPVEIAWENGSLVQNSENVPTGNFAEKFTDLLLSCDRGLSLMEEGRGESGEADDGHGSGSVSGRDYQEDNNNYWDSILNLVNSSPSDDAPMF